MMNQTYNQSMANVTSHGVDSELPVEIKSILLVFLTTAVLYGICWNILLLLQLALHSDVRKHAGTLLMVLLAVNIFQSAVPSLTFLLRIVNVAVDNSALCHITSVGMVFTNNMNLMIMSSMAIQRYHLVLSRPIGRRFVVMSVVAMTLVAVALSIYQALRPGISYFICESLGTSNYDQFMGTSGIMWIMMMPFVVCCILSFSMYLKIYSQVNRNLHLQNINRILVRPLMWLFGMFLLSYLPVVMVILIRRATSLTPPVVYSQLVVNAGNFLGHAVSPSVYFMRSGHIMRKVLQKLCRRCKRARNLPPPKQLIIVIPDDAQKRQKKKKKHKKSKRKRRENYDPAMAMEELNKRKSKDCKVHPVQAEIGHCSQPQEKGHATEKENNPRRKIKASFPLLVVPPAPDDGLKVAPYDGIRAVTCE